MRLQNPYLLIFGCPDFFQSPFHKTLIKQFNLIETKDPVKIEETLNTHPIDLILIGQEGLPIFDSLENRIEKPPVLMLSSLSMIEKAFEVGCQDFLSFTSTPVELEARIRLALKVAANQKATQTTISKLKERSEKDGLTGLYNRSAFYHYFKKEVGKSKRSNKPLSLLMIDLDNFKEINDSYGHAAGDQILVQFAKRIEENLRQYDIICRYGGDEFVILLTETDQTNGHFVAKKLWKCISSQPFPISQKELTLTVSIGVCEVAYENFDLEDKQAFEKVLNDVDLALYQAKTKGRNCVITYDQTQSTKTY